MADVLQMQTGENFSDSYNRTFSDGALTKSQTNVLNLDDVLECGSGVLDDDVDDELYGVIDDDVDECATASDSLAEPEIELSPDGVLDENTVSRGLSNLGRSADGTLQVYLHLTIPGFSLVDISLLQDYVHLQRLEIPYNNLTDLSALGCMTFLLELDASHNQLTKLLDFTPPKNLKCADFSFNMIEEMSDLSAHHYLSKLNLDNNKIDEIKGIENCSRLSFLSLAHNKISKMRGLGKLPIKYLNLRSNAVTVIDDISQLKHLQEVNFAGNSIRSMKGLEKHDVLEIIDLEGNEIIDMTEMQYVDELPLLRNLNLMRNPIQELPDYRLSVLYRVQRLNELDRHKVDAEEKVAAMNMYNPSLEVVAARDHIMHTVYNFLQPQRIRDSTLPSMDTPYPMLVLVGPQGSGKKDLAQKLVEEFPDYFSYGVSSTTRRPHDEEGQNKDYNFISIDDFENDIKDGQFLLTYNYAGNWYGLQREAVERVAREGLACVVNLELEGVLSLKNTHFEPRYIFVMPMNRESHERRLRERGHYSEPQIEYTLNRADLYVNHHQQHPGFFDMVVATDDIAEAYRKLRRIVMEYLGINIPSPSQSETASIAESQGENLTSTYTHGSNAGARSISRFSVPDSMSTAQHFVQKRGSCKASPTGRGVVEEASLRRRQSAAKEAVAGYVPSLYEQILSRAPRTAPQGVEAQLGLGDDSSLDLEAKRSYSAPIANPSNNNMDEIPPGSPDSSAGRSSSSSMNSLSSAQRMHRESMAGSDNGGGGLTDRTDFMLSDLPVEKIDPLELMSGEQSFFSRGQSPEIMRPRSGERTASAMSGRPGSDRHPVLPPITSQT